jgi:uncharacterized protein (TIGR03435 family)
LQRSPGKFEGKVKMLSGETMEIRPAILLLFTLAGYAQQAADPPRYDVSSIKPNTGADFRYTFHIERDGTIIATGITLRRLMMTAYVAGYKILGGPDWVSSKRWDVQAKANRTPLNNAENTQMLRALLADRFQLRTHSEKRNRPVYELTVARKGPVLQRVEDSNIKLDIRTGNGLIRFTKATVATFASQLSYALGRAVIDKTGILGEFSFDLEWTPVPGEDGGPTSSGLPPGTPVEPPPTLDGPSIFTAIEQQLGLRLKSARGPVEVLVIDGAQLPTGD